MNKNKAAAMIEGPEDVLNSFREGFTFAKEEVSAWEKSLDIALEDSFIIIQYTSLFLFFITSESKVYILGYYKLIVN